MTARALRPLLTALAAAAAVPGFWATLAPRSFYDDFPGTGHWVSKAPPYNEHLVTDAGAFYIAFALLFAWAAHRPARALVVPVCAAFALFSALHLVWHVTHLDGFAVADAIAETASLTLVLAGSLGGVVLGRRS